jgi:hypothetical protein
MRITRLAPEFIKAPIREYFRRSAVRNAVLLFGNGVTDKRLEDFHKAWGNWGFPADLDCLRQLACLLEKNTGPVLECGSGSTTLLSNQVGLSKGFWTYSLEQDKQWVTDMRALLGEHSKTRVMYAPLGDQGGHYFYETAEYLPDHFSLIICDGPFIDKDIGEPWYSGWRYGLLPWLKRGNKTFGLILLDDMNDPRAEAMVARWVKEFGVGVQRIKSSNGELAIVTA